MMTIDNDQGAPVKVDKLKKFSMGDKGGLKLTDVIVSVNGEQVAVFEKSIQIWEIILTKVAEMTYMQVCLLISKAGTKMEMVVERFPSSPS